MKAQKWPKGKVAVMVTCTVETWSKGRWPSYFTRTTPLKEGYVDRAGIGWSEYGAKEGVWRLFQIFERHNVTCSLQINGASAERFPEIVREAVARGHKPVGHAYWQDELLLYKSPDEERDTIRRSIEVIEKAGGVRPTGWGTPIYGFSDKTTGFLIDEKIEWTHDCMDTSGPWMNHADNGDIMMFPWTDFVDNRLLKGDPTGLFGAQRSAFDYLHANEELGIVHVGLHTHVGGRPTMAAQVDRLLTYFREFDDVWFTDPGEITEWMVNEGIEDATFKTRYFEDA